jgi:hypothetical protein
MFSSVNTFNSQLNKPHVSGPITTVTVANLIEYLDASGYTVNGNTWQCKNGI